MRQVGRGRRLLPPPAKEECSGGPEPERWDGKESDRPWEGRRRRRKRQTKDWAELIRRSLKLDVLACPKCGSRMKVIATITEPGLVRRMLRSMGLSAELPARAPPRSDPSGEFDFAQ